MSVIGERLKSVREAKGLSLRKLAREIDEDFTLLAHIERGDRFPPKRSRKKFAPILALTPEQLDALIAVERRKLNPHQMLPQIPPAHVPNEAIEQHAEATLNEYCRKTNRMEIECPIEIEQVVRVTLDLTVKHIDLAAKAIASAGGRNLYGCLFPDVFEGNDKLVLVNSGRVNRQLLSPADKRITVAHEAGHYVLHCPNKESPQLCFRFTKGPTFCREAECQDKPFDLREHQATVFAACLLMPRDHFRRQWHALRASIAEIAKFFRVTESLVRFRAEILGLSEQRVDNQ